MWRSFFQMMKREEKKVRLMSCGPSCEEKEETLAPGG